jgi:hypothetical protein
MRMSLSFSVLAALSFAGAACAQTQPAPRSDTQLAAASPKNVTDGMKVRSESGELLGSVSSIVPSGSGAKSYVVVADSQGRATPLPYSVASSMVQKHTLVVSESKFDKAPKVQDTHLEDDTYAHWQDRADRYWSRYPTSPEGGVLR